MRKNMYLAMKNLAEYVASSECYDFETIWSDWKKKYNPDDSLVSHLRQMGEQLCNIDKTEIKDVPERKYRETIKRMIQPEINKEELSESGE